jgi:hypothetical protein
VGCIKIERESHESLSWIFGKTGIPILIQAQEAGYKPKVRGIEAQGGHYL